MARNGPSPSANGKAKAYGPPTRAFPRLATLRSQAVANSQLETPVTPANNVPTSSQPPKKRPIQMAISEGTSKAAARSFRRRSQRIAAIGRTFFQASEEQEVISVSSDSEPEPKILKEVEEVEEDPEEDPVEAPQGAGIEEEDEENPEEDPMEGNAAEEGVHEEDDFADYWALANIGAEVAKEGTRNEEITKKSLEANSDAYVYAPMVFRDCGMHGKGLMKALEANDS
ncbi:hypothetical protein PIB30_075261 [Stylosanthes scabra]|uniref:Uncharacterized protein n=1 Tax=Stylosanthes scabra TaxID=79078 RepID=A0ABU6QS80_9FABA|nr:hypothetical protein [Stylosanthes scabra]